MGSKLKVVFQRFLEPEVARSIPGRLIGVP
jgi:hypothetical protein